MHVSVLMCKCGFSISVSHVRNGRQRRFLLSKNHMNSIITHDFDFSSEEVLAYYISFLKSLSMKLTSDTLLFFHNEHLPQVGAVLMQLLPPSCVHSSTPVCCLCTPSGQHYFHIFLFAMRTPHRVPACMFVPTGRTRR